MEIPNAQGILCNKTPRRVQETAISEVPDFLPYPCHVFSPENPLTHLSASKAQPSTIVKMLHSSDATSQGSFRLLLLHSELSQPTWPRQ